MVAISKVFSGTAEPKRSVTPLLCQCVTSLSLQTVVPSMLILHYFLMRLINFSKQSNSFPVGEFQTRPHVMNLYTKKKELLNWGVFDWRAGGFSRSTWMKTTSPFIQFRDVRAFLTGVSIGRLPHSAWNLVACNPSSAVELKFISVGCKRRKSGRVNAENCQYLMTRNFYRDILHDTVLNNWDSEASDGTASESSLGGI